MSLLKSQHQTLSIANPSNSAASLQVPLQASLGSVQPHVACLSLLVRIIDNLLNKKRLAEAEIEMIQLAYRQVSQEAISH